MLAGFKSNVLPFSLLNVRQLQFSRELQTLGWLHKLLFTFLLLAAVTLCYHALQKYPSCWYVVSGLWLLAWLAQIYRPDKNFIFLHLAKPWLAIFLEYAVISLPFILPALFSPNWYCFFVFLAGLLPITFIRFSFSTQTRFVFLGKLFPPTAFEFIAGFRQALPLLVPVYLLALAFCWVKILPIALLWLFCGIFLGFYQLSEPLQLLRAVGNDPKGLLKKKILQMGKLLLLICLPVIFLQTIFHPWLGLAGLGFLVLQFCVLAFAILLKYSAYEPNRSLNSNVVLLAIAQMSVVIPFFLLLPLALVFRQYARARQNLSFYLPPC